VLPIANFPVADSFNRQLERDVSNGDMPNVFVASFTYDLPNPGGFLRPIFSHLELGIWLNHFGRRPTRYSVWVKAEFLICVRARQT
jgi:hypothetical protein